MKRAKGPAGAMGSPKRSREDLAPAVIEAAMVPIVLALFIDLRAHGLMAREPVWVYFAIMGMSLAAGVPAEIIGRANPTPANLQILIAIRAVASTAVIFVTGWGPVLSVALVFMAVESIHLGGSRSWGSVTAWNLAAFGGGLFAVWRGWAPSFLSLGKASSIGLLGAVAMVAVNRMVGALEAQKEEATNALRSSEERFRSLVQHSSDTTIVIDNDELVVYASPATQGLMGRESDDVVGSHWSDLVVDEDRDTLAREIATKLTDGVATEPFEIRVQHGDGTARFAEAILSDLRTDPSVEGIVANLRDITDRKAAESLVAFQATHDQLTGLPNRRLFFDRLNVAIARAARTPGVRPAVMFIDLDRFKKINDTFGHAVGDALLVEVAQRLLGVMRESDTVARFGGDEFVVLCEGISDEQDALILAGRLVATLDEPCVIDGNDCDVGMSIGLAFFDGSVNAEQVVLGADAAMYEAKVGGGGRTIRVLGDVPGTNGPDHRDLTGR